MTPLQLIAFGVLFLRSDAQPWNCAAAERCALSLERDFEETIANKNDSYTINFCLKKTKEFRTVCLTNATISCKWGGNEDEYYRLQDLQRTFQQKCSELCPVTKEIQTCSGLIDYPAYINKKFQDFCDSYKRSVNCKDQALAGGTNCSFGEKLYLLDFDQNTLHVFSYICNSGCEDIDTAWAVLERCTSTHNLDNAAPGCKTYQDLELCLSTSKSCPQIHMMAPYFARKYTEYMSTCPLPMPVRTSTSTPTPVQTSTASLEQETTLDSESDVNLTVKDLITTVVSTVHSAMSSSTKDNTTQTVERSDIVCSADSIEVFLPEQFFTVPSRVTWLDPNCSITRNSTHYISTIKHGQCGTTVSLTENNVIFENEINANPLTTQNILLNFGTYPYVIPVKCIYPRKGLTLSSYQPLRQQVRVYEKRFGHLDIDMRQFETNQFRHALGESNYPRKHKLNSDIFFRVALQNVGAAELGIHLDTCIATKTSTPYDNVFIKLIENGCPKVNFVHLLPSPVNETRFSLSAFEFTSSQSNVVYIHCQASVCLATSQCTPDCTPSGRGKRDLNSEPSHLLSMGPLLFVSDKANTSNLVANVIAGVSGTVAMVAIVVAVLGWRRKRSTAINVNDNQLY